MIVSRSEVLFALATGLVLAAIVHLVVVLRVPGAARNDAYSRLLPFAGTDKARLLPTTTDRGPVLPLSDPNVATAACAYDLSRGPVRVTAKTWGEFQSLSLHARGGLVFYALTDRAAVRGTTEVVLMTQAQLTETLAGEDEDEPVRELRIVSPTPEGLIVVRALAPFPSARRRAAAAAESVVCESVVAGR